MSSSLTRTQLLVAVVALSSVALIVVVASIGAPALFADSQDRPDEPSTDGTVGYVEGYWHDDELAVDDRDNAALEDDDLESVVYRSMARVEEIRGLTFQDEPTVDVISREEFQIEHGDIFVDLSEDQQRKQNVTYEALFVVDSETDATAELETMYDGAVEGYYEPATDRIVIVSDNPEEPEVDEVILGHELAHALQDQHFDLTSYERATIDQEAAENGLIEGDAVRIETEYEERCGSAWDCLPTDESESAASDSSAFNWGIYLTIYQPYSDGPAYVDHLRESGDGWDAVDAAYDDPPASSSTVIHHEERDSVAIDVDDRSNDSWERLEIGDEVATETVGEAGMVAMFVDGAFDASRSSVIDRGALTGDDPTTFEYDQPYTDGWAGDELVTYVSAGDDDASASDTGYVWETEWRSTADAQQFLDGYLELLKINGAEGVDDRQDTYVIEDDGYPGAYSLEHDGETVTVVHAPSVDDLEGIAADSAPAGDDTVEQSADDEGTDGDSDDDTTDDTIPGFAAPGAGVAVVIALLAARAQARSDRDHSTDSDSGGRPRMLEANSPDGPDTGPEASAGLETPDDTCGGRGRA